MSAKQIKRNNSSKPAHSRRSGGNWRSNAGHQARIPESGLRTNAPGARPIEELINEEATTLEEQFELGGIPVRELVRLPGGWENLGPDDIEDVPAPVLPLKSSALLDREVGLAKVAVGRQILHNAPRRVYTPEVRPVSAEEVQQVVANLYANMPEPDWSAISQAAMEQHRRDNV